LPGGLGGTYAGNPIACAAALAVLDIFETERIVERAATIAETMKKGLLMLQDSVSAIGDVRGLGCMLAIELVTDRQTKQPDAAMADRIVDHARRRGLLLLKAGPFKNVVRLLPPLTSTKDEIDDGLRRLGDAVHDSLT
jgi:4-aminobutyrate aminotransferase/(S)-3-amino-2-methylpropionate transaminase